MVDLYKISQYGYGDGYGEGSGSGDGQGAGYGQRLFKQCFFFNVVQPTK